MLASRSDTAEITLVLALPVSVGGSTISKLIRLPVARVAASLAGVLGATAVARAVAGSVGQDASRGD